MAREFHVDIDLKGALLLNGSAGVLGQIPYSAGPGTPATWGNPPADLAIRADATTAGTVYMGRAANGTAESSASWTIIRTTYNTVGIRTSKLQAVAVTWTGRASHTYS